jgi:hypothetical protein
MDDRPPLTIEAQTTISMTAAAVIAAVLGLCMYVAGGGVPVLLTSMLIATATGIFAMASWRQAMRNGWRARREDDGDDWSGGGGYEEPPRPEGPSGGIRIDWDKFSSDFWDHVGSRDRLPT